MNKKLIVLNINEEYLEVETCKSNQINDLYIEFIPDHLKGQYLNDKVDYCVQETYNIYPGFESNIGIEQNFYCINNSILNKKVSKDELIDLIEAKIEHLKGNTWFNEGYTPRATDKIKDCIEELKELEDWPTDL